MHINKIDIKGFRSIREKISIPLINSNFKVFVGSNNSGKSNILRAINLFFNGEVEPRKKYEPKNDLFIDNRKNATISIELDFSNSKKLMKNYIENFNDEFAQKFIVPLTLTCYSNGTLAYSFTVKKGRKKNLPELRKRILTHVNCTYIPAIKDIRHILDQEMMRKIVAATFHGWGRGRTSKKLGQQREKFKKIIKDLQSILNISGDLMTNLLSDVIADINKFHFSLPYEDLEGFLGKLIFEISEEGLNKRISLENEGSGIQGFTIYSVLRLLHEMRKKNTYKKSHFIWLIEEPETFMHHDLQKKTFQKLKDYSKFGHILISTHSPMFIDKKVYGNTYHIYKDTNRTNMERVTTKNVFEIVSGSLGVSFGDFINFKKHNILVEGESDKNLILGLNKIFKDTGEKSFDKKDVGIIPCGSANGIEHFFSMYNVFNKYANFIALFDRDEAGITSRERLINKEVAKELLLLIPESDYKKNNEIEDLVDKEIWDLCIEELSQQKIKSKDLIYKIVNGEGEIKDYNYDRKSRNKVKKSFVTNLLKYAPGSLDKYNKYLKIIQNINKTLSTLEKKTK